MQFYKHVINILQVIVPKTGVISHTTENNYQYIYCNKPFLNNIQIKDNHLIAHTGEYVY